MKQHVQAAYIHIPFCRSKCSYCDFISYPGCDSQTIDKYIQALTTEIDLAGQWAASDQGSGLMPLTSVFIGGGTPSVINPDHILKIMQKLRESFALDKDGEFTIEANPGTVTETSLSAYLSAGLNRISYGLQAVQPRLLNLMGRGHTAEDFITSVEMAARLGFNSINADIMFGLPDQTVEDVSQTLNLVFRLPIQHLSFYSLSLEKGTPLYEKCVSQPQLLPDEETDRNQYHYIRRQLEGNGFAQYEISNAAVSAHQCRHNLVYWKALPYYGFGLAAHSYVQDKRMANTINLNQYIQTIASARMKSNFPVASVLETLDRQSMMQELMILGLRLLVGVEYEEFYQRFNTDMRDVFARELKLLADRGLIQIGKHSVRLSEHGLDIANQVFSEFI